MKTGTQTIPRVRQRAIADIQCWHSRQHAIHCHSMQCMRKRQRDREESRGRKREEEYSHVCISLSISLSLHLPQSVLWRADKLKNRLGERGLLQGREYRLAREREADRQRNRGREQVSEILPFICLSFTPLCSLVVWRGDWFSDAGVLLLIGPLLS